MLRTIVFVLLATLLAGCDGEGSGQPLQLSETDNGGTVEVSKGQAFSVALPGNPTTGYTWVVMAGDQSIAAQVGEFEFESEASNNTTVGAGGMIILNFEAAGQGETTLELGYRRPWEDNPPEETFSITIVVK